MIDYGVKKDAQKMSFVKPAKSCPHLLKIKLLTVSYRK